VGAEAIAGADLSILILSTARHELMLFAALGLAIGGIDDLALDLLFLLRKVWRRFAVYSRFQPATTLTLTPAEVPGILAIFVPAWQEADVIGAMLRSTLRKWMQDNYRIFVGVYPNDSATIRAVADVAATDSRVILAMTDRPGPTTKAHCLNTLWAAMLREEAARGIRFKAMVLHDAEDVVHPDALNILDRMTDRFDLVQLPVLPLTAQHSRWIAGHYCDEFAESHAKSMAVREALGAAVPSAGVGCAFSRSALMTLAARHEGKPFDPESLTEDYEIGLRIVEMGGRSIFVRIFDGAGQLVCTREHFPDNLRDAVRQKARWTLGIALSGWDRMGWHGGFAERWMRLRDRRAALAALVLLAAYLSLLLIAVTWLLEWWSGQTLPTIPPFLQILLWCNAFLMVWRMGMRATFVGLAYGWGQALLSIPRTVIANAVAILAARRAMGLYIKLLRGRPLVWDKTQHRFPNEPEELVS
jgi:adsorption protein B